MTTGKTATMATGAGNTVIFPAGSYVFGQFSVPAFGTMVLQSGADVSELFLNAPVPTSPSQVVGSLTLEPHATLDTGGLSANTVDLKVGAVLDLYGSTSGPDPNATGISTLVNQGGNLDLAHDPLVTLGELPSGSPTVQTPDFVELAFAYDPAASVSSIDHSQSVIPSTNTLEIALGAVLQGSGIAPLPIDANDPSADNTPINVQIGSGFTPSLSSSAALQSSAATPLGRIGVETATFGAHTMRIIMTNTHLTVGGAQASGPAQVLVLTDTVVASVPGGGGGFPCFVSTTRIRNAAGQWRPVEHLRPGDRLAALRRGTGVVTWIGHRRMRDAAPVVIEPFAFGNAPIRSLCLSPDHAVLVDDVLIPIRKLLNGTTIRRASEAGLVIYVHVELARHDIVCAEGLNCESFLDTGNRGQFDSECGMRPMYDNQRQEIDGLTATLNAYRTRGAAALCLDGPIIETVRANLLARPSLPICRRPELGPVRA